MDRKTVLLYSNDVKTPVDILSFLRYTVFNYTNNLYASIDSLEEIMAPEPGSTAHITPQPTLVPAIHAWRIYLDDQVNSPHTVKAFTADLFLLATFLPPDKTIGS